MNAAFYKVIHLIPGLFLGGSEKVLELIARHQSELGCEVTVIIFEKSGFEKYFPQLRIRYCEIKYQDALIRKPTIQLQEYESIITELSPNVIHSHSYWTDLISQHNNRSNIFYISHFHLGYDAFNNFKFDQPLKFRVFNWIDKQRIIRKYNRVNWAAITASPFLESFLIERFPKKLHSKINCIPNPVDEQYFEVKQTLPCKYDFLTIGRLEEVKDHDFLLNVLFELKKRDFEPRVAIVGEGSLRDFLERKSLVLGLSENVKFLGAQRDLNAIFSISAAYIHTARSETFGLSIYEAIAAGLPVIVRKFYGMDEVLINSSNSIIIEEENTESFAVWILKIIKDELLTSKRNMGESIRHLSSKNYLGKMDLFYEEKLKL